MSEKLIRLKDINNWENYSVGLNNKEFVKRYLESILKKWVKKHPNPLSINWVQKLYEDKLENLDKILKVFENKMGKENLKSLLEELKKEGGNAESVTEKIESLIGEIIAFDKLTNEGYTKLRKIHEIGDWENDTTIISVKSILDLDLNYQLIENTIHGMIYVEENNILRKYSKIIPDCENEIDFKFRKEIIWFLENSLLNTLQFIDTELSNTVCVDIKERRVYFRNKRQTGDLQIRSYGDFHNSEKTILVILKETRYGLPGLEKQLKIRFRIGSTEYVEAFPICFPTDIYWGGEELNFDYLRKSIQEKLDKIDRNRKKVNDKKNFMGWINISIHSMHECYVLEKKKKIGEFMKISKGDRDYKVIFCLNPQRGFDLKKAIIFEV